MNSLTVYSALYAAVWLLVFSHRGAGEVLAFAWKLLVWLGNIG